MNHSMETRRAAHSVARERVCSMLESLEVSTFGREFGDAGSEEAYQAAYKLLDRARAIQADMKYLESQFENAKRFISGQHGTLNSLGIVQGNGPALDVKCAMFHVELEAAIQAECNAILINA